MLRARLLGAFEVTWQGQPVAGLNAPRLQSLLACLMLHRGTLLSRQHIAFTFWPDLTDDKARNNLRQLVHQLRRALPESNHFLQADASAIGWLNVSDFQLDVAAFEDAIANSDAARKAGYRQSEMASLERAADLYSGDLLPGCYDDWVLPERERLRQSFASVLDQLAALHEVARNVPAAIAATQRRLELDPLHEAGYVTLMRLHALNDDRAGAFRIYQTGVGVFKSELGIEPGEAMQAAHERLKQGLQTPAQDSSQALPPLIGRQREWAQLLSCWQLAAKGAAQFSLISGEAGIGKTRLAEELMDWTRRQGIGVAHARAYAAEGRLSFAPVAEWLRSDGIHASLQRLDKVWRSEVGRILPEVFVAQPDLPQPEAMTDATQRTRFFEALARAVLAAPQPLLLVLDDVQWCDQDTLEWLRYLLRFDAKARLLIVATCRTEEIDDRHPLMALLRDLRNAGALHEIELKPLDAAETAKVAGHILQRSMELSEATRLFSDTEGNPLFTVEMARAGLRSEGEIVPEAGLNLPPRIHAVIASRFAQVSAPAMEVLQLGATMGRAFSFDVLAKASDAGEESLLRSLDELWQRRIVRGQDGDRYDFTHDKLREVAYVQIGPAKRRLLHRRAAQAIEAVHAANLDPVSAQLAAHYEQGGDYKHAVVCYLRAARLASQLFVYEETAKLCKRGLRLLEKLNAFPDREETELALLMLSGLHLNASASLVDQKEALQHARRIMQRAGGQPTANVIRAEAYNYVVQTEFDMALENAEWLYALSQQNHDAVIATEARQLFGVIASWKGEFNNANHWFRMALDGMLAEHSIVHAERYQWDARVSSLSRFAQNMWCLGYPKQAHELQQKSLNNVLEQDRFGQAYGHFHAITLDLFCGRYETCRTKCAIALAYCKTYSLVYWHRLVQFMDICCQLCQNANGIRERVVELEVIFDEVRRSGNSVNYLMPAVLLGERLVQAGRNADCITLLDEMNAGCETTGNVWFQADLQRVRGNAFLDLDTACAETAYKQAIWIAQKQKAKSFELRAVTDLARLWQMQGRRAEARDLLQPIYDWFTEGFDTRDLKEAKALLDELTIS